MIVKTLKIFLSVIILSSTSLFAQSSPTIFHNSKYYAIGGKNILLLSNGLFAATRVSDQIGIEANLSAGPAFGIEAGINYFLLKSEKRYNPYTGLHAGWMTMTLLTRSDYTAVMIPIGLELYKNRWLFGVETGYMFMYESAYHQGDFSPYRHEIHHIPYFSGKIGLRFPR